MKIITSRSGGFKLVPFKSEKIHSKKEIGKDADKFGDYCRQYVSNAFIDELQPLLRDHFGEDDERIIKIRKILDCEE